MSEYVITLEQMQELVEYAAVEAVDGYKNGVAKQVWSFPKLPKIVRCRDCKYLNIVGKCPCGFWALENLSGFCAWGERRSE